LGRKAVSGIMLALFLIGLSTLVFNIQFIEAVAEVILSDKEIIPNAPNTSSIAFTATVISLTTTRIWFQIKATLDETGTRFSQCAGWGEYLEIQDSRRLTIIF